MNLVLDNDLKAVVEFMQSSIPTGKPVRISEKLPEIARLKSLLLLRN